MAELGFTEQELADRLNDAVRDITGTPSRATSRYVRMLLDGTIRWPWPNTRAALEKVLGLPILQLGFAPRPAGGRSRRAAPPAEPPPAAVPQQQTPVVDVVAVVDGRRLSIGVPPLPPTRFGVGDLARLAGPLAEVYDLHARYGPIGLAAAGARQAARLSAAHGADLSGVVRAGLYALTGQWWTTAAWAAVNVGEQATAGRYLRRALWQSCVADDPLLDAHIGHVRATWAGHLGAAGEVAAAARALLGSARQRNRTATAVGHMHAAQAHAMRHQLPAAERCLDQASQTLRATAGGEPVPLWLTRIGVWTVDAYRARAALMCGRYDLAVTYGEQAVAALPPGQVWDRLLALLDLACAYLGQREVEQAAADATTALDLVPRLNHPWGCGPVTDRLERIAKQFAAWAEIPQAQQWGARYRDTVAARVTEAAGRPPHPMNLTQSQARRRDGA